MQQSTVAAGRIDVPATRPVCGASTDDAPVALRNLPLERLQELEPLLNRVGASWHMSPPLVQQRANHRVW